MPKNDDRFYLMEMRNRAAVWGDIGSLIRLEGVVVGGGGERQILMLPGCAPMTEHTLDYFVHELNIQEWSDWLQHSDHPEILIGPVVGDNKATITKIWHRKLRYEISGAVQQKIWAADRFQCMYCGRKMGDVLMTVDHFIPLELGGKNDVTNYLSSCKPCNKAKGSRDPKEFCSTLQPNWFEFLAGYLAKRQV
jgi:hypothetical protein